MDTVTLYVDGVAVASTATNNVSYVAMENLTSVVGLGKRGEAANFWDGKMAGGPLGPFFTQSALSATDVADLYDLGKAALGLP